MNLDELEKERKKILLEYSLIYLFMTVISYIIILHKIPINSTLCDILGMICCIVFFCTYLQHPGKHFEDKVKRLLIPQLLKDITTDKGQISWVNNISNTDNNLRTTDMYSITRDISFFSDDLLNLFECKYDEAFYGIYNKVKFFNIEYNQKYIYFGKYNWIKFLEGNVLGILCKQKPFNGKTVLTHIRWFSLLNWKEYMRSGLNKIKYKVPLKNKKLQVYTNNIKELDKIFTEDFIKFANSLGKQYSFVFKNNAMYVISEDKKDKFKMGSLFKKVDNKRQYEKCKNDLLEMLDIIVRAKNISWVDKNKRHLYYNQIL